MCKNLRLQVGKKKIRKNQNKNKPYGIHTQMPLKQPQTFLLPQAANVVKQLLGWGTSKVHWEQQFYFSIKHRNRAFFFLPSLSRSLLFFSEWNSTQASWFQKPCSASLDHSITLREAQKLQNETESYRTKKTFLYFIKVENCCIPSS